MTETKKLPRLTPNMKTRLLWLGRAVGRPEWGRWKLDKELGGPAALHHLYVKGYVERRIEVGPRGGERVSYRPNAAGWEFIGRTVEREAKGKERMSLVEIDTILIRARDAEKVVRIFADRGGDGLVEYRGVPRTVERGLHDGKLYVPVGTRMVPLALIVRVEA